MDKEEQLRKHVKGFLNGQKDKAISDLEKCLEINPNSIHSLNLSNIRI